MVNFYHRFIPHATWLLLQLHCALQKSHSQKVLSWTADMDMAFAFCKEALAEATMLSQPKHGAHISLTTDASDQAIRDVLEQWIYTSPHHGHRGPLQHPYDGPFQVVAPSDKTFRIMAGDREEIISVDRLKPVHVDLTSPVPVA
ncbi:transposon ty3-g Gag-Pol polyprotein [Plakobranchus ocellatus]|uniref:Transposon ty3-g Gag-Pol polyprotein n=1 Tax=Plakobranchus ocellatus TaxID=259542 RepID=A0AAV3YFT5_9GAST|nr:transposon ty3-g Gag-Pol polyprotein [Plakobranchus ocellatus]